MPSHASTRALRVLLVTPRFYPSIGGVETHVYEVGRRMAAQGVNICVLTTDTRDGLPEEEMVEGMHVRRVRAWPANGDYYLAPGVWREILSRRWDVVHCQGVHTFVPPLAMLAARRVGTPYVLTFHTGGHSSNWRNAIRAGQWRMLRPLLAGARKLIAVSSFEAHTFRAALALPPDRFAVIANGSNLTESLGESSRHSVRSPSTRDDAPLILSVGRLERYKGHQRAIAALPHVRAVYPGAHLLILGTGSYERALRDQVQALGLEHAVEIRSIPPGSREMMAATVAKAAVVVLLSEYESQGIAVMEALSLGRPVVVADTTALHDLAEQGLARAVSIKSTPEQVAEAILSQIRQPLVPDRPALPTWEQCAADLLAVYAEAAPVAC